MKHPIRALLLGCVLAFTPACASIGQSPPVNPVAAARTLDQRAYAVLHAYAAVIEKAADIVRDPSTPLALARALGRAERVATPVVEALEIAVAAYLRAQADFEAANGTGNAALALTLATQRLREALVAAQAPVIELERLVRQRPPCGETTC